jgi:hypothetical protein
MQRIVDAALDAEPVGASNGRGGLEVAA